MTTWKNHILDWQTTHLRHDITDTQAASEMNNTEMQQPSVITYIDTKRQKHKLLTVKWREISMKQSVGNWKQINFLNLCVYSYILKCYVIYAVSAVQFDTHLDRIQWTQTYIEWYTTSIEITRSTRRAQTLLDKADHYSHIAHWKNVEPWR